MRSQSVAMLFALSRLDECHRTGSYVRRRWELPRGTWYERRLDTGCGPSSRLGFLALLLRLLPLSSRHVSLYDQKHAVVKPLWSLRRTQGKGVRTLVAFCSVAKDGGKYSPTTKPKF